MNKKLFLSAVSNEFEAYRSLLAGDLKRPTLDVAVQEDFGVIDGTTLQKLDTYIRACDGVVHLIGKAVGAIPETITVQALLARYPDLPDKLPPLAAALALPDSGISYTQWEAFLAIYHQRPIFVYRPTDFDLAHCDCPRAPRFAQDAAQEQAQREHYARIRALGRDRGQFRDPERLSSAVLRDLVEILPALEEQIDISPTRLTHTAEILVGRERELSMLDEAWNTPRVNLVVVRGKGGEGKTSLVATWMAEMACKGWRGAERVLDWSFYSQGTRDQSGATAEFFINQCLMDLGDPDPYAGGPEERAARLVVLLNSTKTLLVLDGLEPLQYPPGAMHGALKDRGMAALLRGLVAHNHGLVIVTTREKVTEIQQHYGRSAIDHDLSVLSPLAGAQVLHNAGATRAGAAPIQPDDAELQRASTELQGHALTLFLVGQYLKLTERGDIRRRDTLRLAEAEHEYSNDATRPYGHAFKAMEAYERWFEAGDEAARLQLSILRMLGLFDRPASAECLAALRAGEVAGLTDVWKQRSDRDWRMALARLAEIKLIEHSDSGSVDAHPLIREYFGEQLQTHRPDTYQAAHSRLFDFLCENTPYRPDGLAGLGPLYQAVTHGCLAGRQQEVCDKVYVDRIQRGTDSDGFYSTRQLGAYGADLAAVAAFIGRSSSEPWSGPSSNLSSGHWAWLLNQAAVRFRALGRLTEALQPMAASLEMRVQREEWKSAAIVAGNLSELTLTLGRVLDAVRHARQSITLADRSTDASQRMSKRTTAAEALHQSGNRVEAGALYTEAEAMQRVWQPQFTLLYSLPGFRYCDWLLTPAEVAGWRRLQHQSISLAEAPLADAVAEVEHRGHKMLEWRESNDSRLDIALDHLTLARVGLFQAILVGPVPQPTLDLPHVRAALQGLRAAGTLDHIPRSLLTAALYHHVRGEPALAEKHLAEAQQIAERGPMPLFLADVHLHRARMFRDRDELGKAAKLIGELGYGRRYEELADAEAALG